VRAPIFAISAACSTLLIGAPACGPPDYARRVERADSAPSISPITSATLDPGLLAYWRFDDGAGTVVTDSSGRGHDGTLIGNGATPVPVWTTGKVRGALALNGQTFVRVPDSPDWDQIGSTNAFTVVAWVIRQTAVIGWNTLVSRQYQITQWEHFNLGFKGEYLAPVAGTQINEFWYCTASAPTTRGLWMHIAGTYDGTTLRGYENGVEICHIDFTTALLSDDTGLIIGGKTNAAGPIVEQVFTGLVDELAIYTRAFGASEIADLAAEKPIAP
jgi:Concanavalin A-like lectin/glucanases superfamily